MKTNLPENYGQTSFADPLTGLQVDLPLGFRIYRSVPGKWLGASDSDRYFLYVERNASTRLSPLPVIMLDPALDLFVSGLGRKIQKIVPQVWGLQVEGSMRDRQVSGYLAGVSVRGTSFLVMILHSGKGSHRMTKSFALMTIENILLAEKDGVVF